MSLARTPVRQVPRGRVHPVLPRGIMVSRTKGDHVANSGGARRDLHGDWREREVRRATVAAHIEVHGMRCPGYNRAPHTSIDLTADHPVPVGAGGEAVGQAYVVLCRSCNASKGKSTGRELAHVPEVRSRKWI